MRSIVLVACLLISCGGSSFEAASISPDAVSPFDAGAAGEASGEFEASSTSQATSVPDADRDSAAEASLDAGPCTPQGCYPVGNCCTKDEPARCGTIEPANAGQSLVCVPLP
jgi:hypothetical protein